MRYLTMTDLPPEEVLERARHFFAENTLMQLAHDERGTLTFRGDIGTAVLKVDRKHGHTNVHAETNRVAGLDVTDVTKRFLYTLKHI